MLKLKLQYFGHSNTLRSADSLEKTEGKDWGQEEKGTTEDEMAGWHHWLDGPESQWTPGVCDEQGGLVCWDWWGHKELDTTEWLIWSDGSNSSPWQCQTRCHTTNTSKVVWFASSSIVPWPLNNWLPLLQPTPQLFVGKMLPQLVECRKHFQRVHWNL